MHTVDALRAASAPPCDPRGRAVRRFHPAARSWILERLVADPSGRLLDLARVCPGAILFARGLHGRGEPFRSLALATIRCVIDGERLRPVLSGAAAEFLRLEHGGFGLDDARRLRLLIRRASPRVAPDDLCGPPPRFFVPEDIPTDRTSPTWYATMRLVTDVAAGRVFPPCLWTFFSRRAVVLAGFATEIAGRGCTRTAAIEDGRLLATLIFERGLETRQWPHRNTDVWRLAREIMAWAEGRVPSTFPEFTAPVPRLDGAQLTPIANGSSLREAAARLKNCLDDCHSMLDKGRCWVFTGTLLGTEVAIYVQFTCGRYVVSQVSGRRNRPISGEQRELLRRWLARLNRFFPTLPTPLDPSDGAQLSLAL